jgi:hypothetical protein
MFKTICFRTYFVPTKNVVSSNDNKTIVTSNVTIRQELCTLSIHPQKPTIPPSHAVADMGATLLMVIKGTPMKNICPATNPLNINLSNGKVVKSMHVCNLEVPGLPYVLKGHIVPDLTVTSLIGVRILCKVGCIVVLTDAACYVMYNGTLF